MDGGRSSPMAISQSPLSRSSSLRVSLNRTSLVRRNQSMNAKQIRFFRNGDRYFCGLKLAVSVERYKEFESLLAELSKKLDLPTGAVRYVFNAENSSIITDISQLQYGIPYVCSSIHSFRQIEGGYGKHMKNWSIISKHAKIENNTSFTKPIVLSNSTSENIIHYNHQNRMEVMREFIKPKLVTVIRNGKPPQKKVTLLLNNKTAISLNQVLDQLSARGSLGKVDKLYTVDCRVVKTLRDLFDDDTVFIALQANEKFPDDGIELDPNSYRITPYRELKRPSSMNVKRSQSLRSSIRRLAKEDSQNISSLMAKNNRPNTSLNGKLGNTNKVARAKSNSNKQIDQNNDELYPTSVFESESSDSARTKKGRRGRRTKRSALDIYNTVWLSDFESSVKSLGSRSGFSSLNQSRMSFNNETAAGGHSTPKASTTAEEKEVLPPKVAPKSRKVRLHRTLSLPEAEMPNLNGEDLHERFTRLQLEQENRELRQLTRQLQETLEKVEARLLTEINNRNNQPLKCPKCVSPSPKTSSPLKPADLQNPSSKTKNPFPIQSPDSLEAASESCKSEKTNFMKINESGYASTYINDSLASSTEEEKDSEYKYMEYSEDCTSEEERHFYASRLARNKHHHHAYNDSVCCITQ